MSMDTPIGILLIEDSAADARLTREALAEAHLLDHLTVVGTGEEALEMLRDGGRPRPDLILLDFNLPGLDGRDVLAEIKADPRLATIPVVVLTTSKADEDVLQAYRLHANCYITKPVDFETFIAVVQSIRDFWMGVVVLPPHPEREAGPHA
jgi:chemotaxis family two-component system response regulator Rcp1